MPLDREAFCPCGSSLLIEPSIYKYCSLYHNTEAREMVSSQIHSLLAARTTLQRSRHKFSFFLLLSEIYETEKALRKWDWGLDWGFSLPFSLFFVWRCFSSLSCRQIYFHVKSQRLGFKLVFFFVPFVWKEWLIFVGWRKVVECWWAPLNCVTVFPEFIIPFWICEVEYLWLQFTSFV